MVLSTIVVFALVFCATLAVGVGVSAPEVWTVVAAVLVGTVLKGITKVLGKQRDAWLGISVEQPCEE